ncbi:MAG: tRNA (cytidine(34)-2'-O)-methyltransferase [Thermoanaerobaculia bacterium]
MPADRDRPRPLIQVVLVEPEIPWNAGNVGRTCLAAGARLHLVRPLGFSLDARHLRRAGLDYWRHVEPRVWPSWSSFQSALPRLGVPYFFSAEAERDLWSIDFPQRPLLIFGCESCGFRDEIRECFRDRLVTIPRVDDRARSLNLSTAAAVAIYEVRRQWSGKPMAAKDCAVPELS